MTRTERNLHMGAITPTETVKAEMSYGAAFALAQRGAKITHRFMAANEWMTVLPNGRICFEDGVEMTIVEFWAVRRGQTGWTDGWSVFKEAAQ